MMRGVLAACFLMATGVSPLGAFTLISANPPRYTSDEVELDFTADSCTNTGYPASELHEMAVEAADNFWNQIPTSRLTLKKGQVRSLLSDGLTLDDLSQASEPNRILIGCNDDISAFATGTVGAVGGISSNGVSVKGAVLLNDHTNSGMRNMSRNEIVALMAHEIGHALGLGHSSVETAVMYYAIGGKIQEQLTQDDYDGLTYLYPQKRKLEGLGGSCGTVEMLGQDGENPGGGTPALVLFPVQLTLGLLLAFLISFFRPAISPVPRILKRCYKILF